MAIYSSVLIWKISWMDELSWLQSVLSQRVRHNLVTDHTSTKLPNELAPASSLEKHIFVISMVPVGQKFRHG